MRGGGTEGNCLTVVVAFFPELKHKGRFSNCLLWQKIISDYLQAGGLESGRSSQSQRRILTRVVQSCVCLMNLL